MSASPPTGQHDLAEIERWISEHGFSRWLGLEVANLSEERVIMRLGVADHMRYISGLLHGGITALLLDTAIGIAARLAVPVTSTVRTTHLETRYIAPGRGQVAFVEANATVCEAGLAGQGTVSMNGVVVAEGTAEFAIVPRGRDRRSSRRAAT
jgi:uncharacterized protein (TIGR00369 family)